ncbi:hypothetical protein TELCIR_18699, partial [Teladorsagia circumcincta]
MALVRPIPLNVSESSTSPMPTENHNGERRYTDEQIADDYTAGYMRSRAMVLYTGTVFWPPPTQLRSTCKVDVSLFPFDEQRCSLKFGSWTYHGFQVDITNRSGNIDLTNYVPSGEFDLVKVLNFHHRGPFNEPVPNWARVLVLDRLRRFLRMKLSNR